MSRDDDKKFVARWRKNSTGETSREAAKEAQPKAPTIGKLSLDRLETVGPATGEMILADLRAAGVKTVLYSVKPRLTDLSQLGLIKDSGRRGISDSGKCRSIIWEATDAEYRAEFAKAKDQANG